MHNISDNIRIKIIIPYATFSQFSGRLPYLSPTGNRKTYRVNYTLKRISFFFTFDFHIDNIILNAMHNSWGKSCFDKQHNSICVVSFVLSSTDAINAQSGSVFKGKNYFKQNHLGLGFLFLWPAKLFIERPLLLHTLIIWYLCWTHLINMACRWLPTRNRAKYYVNLILMVFYISFYVIEHLCYNILYIASIICHQSLSLIIFRK